MKINVKMRLKLIILMSVAMLPACSMDRNKINARDMFPEKMHPAVLRLLVGDLSDSKSEIHSVLCDQIWENNKYSKYQLYEMHRGMRMEWEGGYGELCTFGYECLGEKEGGVVRYRYAERCGGSQYFTGELEVRFHILKNDIIATVVSLSPHNMESRDSFNSERANHIIP